MDITTETKEQLLAHVAKMKAALEAPGTVDLDKVEHEITGIYADMLEVMCDAGALAWRK